MRSIIFSFFISLALVGPAIAKVPTGYEVKGPTCYKLEDKYKVRPVSCNSFEVVKDQIIRGPQDGGEGPDPDTDK